MNTKRAALCLTIILMLSLPACARREAPPAAAPQERRAVPPEFISPEVAQQDVEAGRAVLVCAYDDEEICRKLRIDNAMSLSEFERNLMYLPRDKEIIFYCA